MVFPDIQISIPFPATVAENGRSPILVQKRMASDILMILLDRLPDNGEISTMRFTQPPHRQCFSAGDSLDENTIELMFCKVYRSSANQASSTDAFHEFGAPVAFTWSSTSNTAYNWSTRCLNLRVVESALFSNSSGLPPVPLHPHRKVLQHR